MKTKLPALLLTLTLSLTACGAAPAASGSQSAPDLSGARALPQTMVETIKTRLKSPESILEKLTRKGLPLTVESIEKNLSDIAGVRVICSHPADIYQLAEAFLQQDDITLLQRKDYIANPKPNGYRSLHLIVETPIFLHDEKRLMRAEVQFRTISMDWWASLEHKIRYKKDLAPEKAAYLEGELRQCAELSAALDQRMENLQRIAAGEAAVRGGGEKPPERKEF